jgi:hypothetical protein
MSHIKQMLLIWAIVLIVGGVLAYYGVFNLNEDKEPEPLFETTDGTFEFVDLPNNDVYIEIIATNVNTSKYLVSCYKEGEFIGGIKIAAPGVLEFEGNWDEFIKVFNESLN